MHKREPQAPAAPAVLSPPALSGTIVDLRERVASARNAVAQATAEVEELERQRAALAAEPSAKSDLIRVLDEWVDTQANGYRKILNESIFTVLGQIPLEMDDAMMPTGDRPYLRHPLSQGIRENGTVAVGAMILCIGPDRIKSMLGAEMVRALPGPGGAPYAERLLALEAMDAEIAGRRATLAAIQREVA